MQKRKGFTLVELVIVIAVIAILAGVLIGTFASVINRANASAEVQKTKSEEIAQKAEDILKKIEDSNWYGWEDFETSIVAKITQEIKNNGAGLTADQVKKIIEDALTTWEANKQAGNTELTADQVKAIVENAVGTLHYEGVTEAQVRAIVNASEKNVLLNSITPVQIKQIVTAANEKNLTAAQVANIIANTSATEVSDIITALNTVTAGLATSVEVEKLRDDIKGLAVSETDDVVVAKALNIKLKKSGLTTTTAVHPTVVFETIQVTPKLKMGASDANDIMWDSANNSFVVVKLSGETYVYSENTATETAVADKYKLWKVVDTIVSDSPYSQYLLGTNASGEINVVAGIDVGQNTEVTKINYNRTTGDAQTVVIRTNGERTALNVNAPNDTVHHYDFLDELTVTAVAEASYHEHGRVRQKAVVKQGHFVVENGAEVPQLSVENVPTGKTVKVTANEETTISIDDSSSERTSVVANSEQVYVDGIEQSAISGQAASSVKTPSVVTTETQLRTANNSYVKLGADIEILTDEAIQVTKKCVLDLNGHNISFGTNIGDESDLYRVGIDGELIIKGSGKITTNSRMIYVEGSLRIEDGTFVTTVMTDGANLHSMILSAAGSEVVINDGEFYTAKCAVTTFGDLVINGGKFVSIASSVMPKTTVVTAPYSYTIRVEGGAVFNGGSIYGIQGAIAVDGGDAVINNVYAEASAEALDMYKLVQSTVHHLNNKESSYAVESFNKTTYLSKAYYALYCAGEFGVVTTTVNGGEFVNKGPQVAANVGNSTIGDGGERLNATVLFNGGKFVSQQNANVIAVDYYVGTIQISGGNYNKNQVKNGHGSPATIPLANASEIIAEGYQVVAETDGTWSVVAK